VNDFLKAAASATADAPDPASLDVLADAGLGAALADAGAEVPPKSEHTSLTREGGPLESIIPAGTDNFGPADAPSAIRTVLTANPNRTKAPRQEVDR